MSADILEEYETWKQNCPMMYTMVSETTFTWESLTVEWFSNPSSDVKKMVTSTHSGGEDTDYLQIVEVDISNLKKSDKGSRDSKGHKVEVVAKYPSKNEINRARINPKNNDLVATISGVGEVCLYDLKKDVSQKPKELGSHGENGFGLGWNSEGVLASGADNGKVMIWDGTNFKQLYEASAGVNDVTWSIHDPKRLAAAIDDGYTCLLDTRSKTVDEQRWKQDAAVNCVSISPFSSHLIATGSSQGAIVLWDDRNLKSPLHTLIGHHEESITALKWNPHVDGILASSADYQDRRVIIWNIARIGEEQTPDEAEDGAPELLFMHGGHTDGVNDFDWNPDEDWVLASVSKDTVIQVWEPSPIIVDSSKSF